MIVSELIEWLQTMPQNAKVQVLSHSSGGGYYDQGGNCCVEDFHNHVEYQQWKDVGDTSEVDYIYGLHFELSKFKGEYELQLGVKDK
jgi:hypothetical protein